MRSLHWHPATQIQVVRRHPGQGRSFLLLKCNLLCFVLIWIRYLFQLKGAHVVPSNPGCRQPFQDYTLSSFPQRNCTCIVICMAEFGGEIPQVWSGQNLYAGSQGELAAFQKKELVSCRMQLQSYESPPTILKAACICSEVWRHQHPKQPLPAW